MNFHLLDHDWSRSKTFAYVVKHMGDGCCTTWPFGTVKGYALMRAPRNGGKVDQMVRVCRLVCELTHGPAPKTKPFARHLCGKGNLGCFNAGCLVWGSKQENEGDKRLHGTILAGEKHNMAKLTWKKVQKIRAAKGHIRQADLAKQYGVCRGTIAHIHQGLIWTG